jgi:hypothetical protein
MAQRKPHKVVLVAVVIGHILVTALTWRDLNHRSGDQLRGSKTFWRVVSALNTTGSLAYILLARKRGSAATD